MRKAGVRVDRFARVAAANPARGNGISASEKPVAIGAAAACKWIAVPRLARG